MIDIHPVVMVLLALSVLVFPALLIVKYVLLNDHC